MGISVLLDMWGAFWLWVSGYRTQVARQNDVSMRCHALINRCLNQRIFQRNSLTDLSTDHIVDSFFLPKTIFVTCIKNSFVLITKMTSQNCFRKTSFCEVNSQLLTNSSQPWLPGPATSKSIGSQPQHFLGPWRYENERPNEGRGRKGGLWQS